MATVTGIELTGTAIRSEIAGIETAITTVITTTTDVQSANRNLSGESGRAESLRAAEIVP
jgi:hypothetical protein